MKIQYASDLHLEFDSNANLVNSEGFLKPVGDILLLAGDIIYLEDEQMESNLMEHDIDCWIYGHTHLNTGSGIVLPSKEKDTTLLCNQLGYVSCDEHREFNSECYVEL